METAYIDESSVNGSVFDETDASEDSDLVLRTLVDFKVFDDRGNLIRLTDLNKNGIVAHCIGTVVEPLSSEVRQYFTKYASTIGSNIVEKDPSGEESDAVDESFMEQPATVSPAVYLPPPKLLTNEDRLALDIGDSLDSYCNRTYRWYESKISDKKVEDDRTLVRIHFLGWSAKYDEWIDIFSDRLATRGSSKALVAAAKQLQTDLVPWYDSERLLQKALQHCCPQSPLLKSAKKNGTVTAPAPVRQKIRIEALEDWCVDFTYANPTLWLISTSGIWYRVSGSLCPGSWRGSPLPEYYPLYKKVCEQYYTTSHVVMSLLDILPINHSVAYNVIVDEASVRSQYVVNEITILKNYEFIIEQVGLLVRPNDWDKKIDFKKCPFISQLRKEGILFFAQGGIQGVMNSNNKNLRKRQDLIRMLGIKTETELVEDFMDAMVDSEDEEGAAAAAAVLPAGGKKVTAKMSVLNQVEEEIKILEALGLNNASHYNKLPILETKLRYPIEDALLLKLEKYRDMTVTSYKEVTLPLPQSSRQFHPSVGSELHSTLLMTYTNLINARHLLNLPYLTVDSFQQLLIGENKTSSGIVHPLWAEVHIKLLSAVLEEYTSPPSIATVNVVEDSAVVTSGGSGKGGAVLVLPSQRGKSFEAFLRCGGAWLEVIRMLMSENQPQHLSTVSFSDSLNPCAGIIRSLLNEPEAADFTFPVDPTVCGLPRYFELVPEPMDLNTVLVRIQSGWYDSLEDEKNFTPLDHSVYHPKDYVQPGRIVDAFCELLSKWVDAHIVSVDYESKSIAVRYCGWGDEYDEKFEFGTNKLLPHKTVIQDKYRRTLSPLELVEKVPLLMETLVRDSPGGSYWVPPKALLPISTQSRGQGHEGFAHDVRLVWNNCIHYYTTVADGSGDVSPLVTAAEQLSAAFERLYVDNVVASLKNDSPMEVTSGVKRVVEASVTDKLKAQLKTFIATSGASIVADIEGSGAENDWFVNSRDSSYQDLSVEARLKLLSWLCSEFMGTNQFRTYLENCLSLQNQADKAASKGKDGEYFDEENAETSATKGGRSASKKQTAVVTPAGKGKRVTSSDPLPGLEDDNRTSASNNSGAYKTPQSKLKKTTSTVSLNASSSVAAANSANSAAKAVPTPENMEDVRSVVLRHLPVGSDRYHNQYYTFHSDPIRPQLYCELSDASRQHLLAQSVSKSGKGRPSSSSSSSSSATGKISVDTKWVIYSTIEDIAALINWLKEKGVREAQLKKVLSSWLESNHLELPKEKESADDDTASGVVEEVVVGTTTGRKRKSLLPSYNDDVNNADEGVTAKRAKVAAAKEAAEAVAVATAEVDVTEAAEQRKALEAYDSKRRSIVKLHGKDFFEFWKNEKPDYQSVNVNNPSFRWLDVPLPESNQMGLGVKELNGGVYVSSFKYSSPSTLTGSAAKTAGFRIGDQILMYNDTVIKSVTNLITAMKSIVDEYTAAAANQRSSRTVLARPVIRVMLGRMDDPYEVRGFEGLALREQEVFKAVLDQRADDKVKKKAILAEMKVRSLSNPEEAKTDAASLPTSPAGNKKAPAPHAMQQSTDNNAVIVVPWQHHKLQHCSADIPHSTIDVLFNTLLQCNHSYCLPMEWINNNTCNDWIFKISQVCNELRAKNSDAVAAKLLKIMKACVLELESALLKCGRLLTTEWSKVAVDANGVIIKDRSKHSVWVLYLSQCTCFSQLGYLVSLLSHSLAWRAFKSDIVQLTLSAVLPTEQYLDRNTIFRLGTAVVYYGAGHAEFLKDCDLVENSMWGSTVLPAAIKDQILKCTVTGVAVYPMAASHLSGEHDSVYTSFVQLTLTVLETTAALAIPAIPSAVTANSSTKLEKHVFNRLLMRVLSIVKRSNAAKSFLDPVDVEEYPDYHRVVKEPVDMNKMLKKCYNFQYSTTDELVADFQLLHDNCAQFCGSEYKRLLGAAASMLSDVKLLINLMRAEFESCKGQAASDSDEGGDVSSGPSPERKRGRPRKHAPCAVDFPTATITAVSPPLSTASDLKVFTVCIPIAKKPSVSSVSSGNSSYSYSTGCEFIVNFERYKESLTNCTFPAESLFTLKKVAAGSEDANKKDKNTSVGTTSLFVGSLISSKPLESNNSFLPWKHLKVEWHSDNYKDKQLMSSYVNPWEIEVTSGPTSKKYQGFPSFI